MMSGAPSTPAVTGEDIVARMAAHIDKAAEKTQAKLDALAGELGTKVKKNENDIIKIRSAIKRIEESRDVLSPAMTKQIEDAVRASIGPSTTTMRGVDPMMITDDQRRRDKYWASRRSIRIWPVKAPDDEYSLRIATGEFLAKKLKMPGTNLDLSKIQRVRKIKTPRGTNKITDELLVTFIDVQARDHAMSHAKNLAEFSKTMTDRPGIRLDYPDFLGPDFRSLETFGARMRARCGEGFKRNIRFDDDNLRLYMDINMPSQDSWTSITPEIAKETKPEEDKKKAESLKRIIRENGQGALDGLFRSLRRSPTKSPRERLSGPPENYEHNRDDFPTV